MKKTFWLLVTFLLLAGCGGLSFRGNEETALPSPSPFLQEFSLPTADRIDETRFGLPQSAGSSEIQSHAESTKSSNTQAGLSYQNEPLFPASAPGELVCRSQALKMVSHLLLPLEEKATNLDSPPLLSEQTFSRQEAVGENEGSELPPTMLPRKIKTDRGYSGSAGRRVGEKFEKNMQTQASSGTDVIGEAEDREPQFILPSGTETIPPSPPSSEMVAEESPQGNKSPSALLVGFPALLNEKVKEFIDFFQTRAATFFTNSLSRSQAYESMMKKIFREKNVPEELFYLALIESGFNPYALSRSKASGIWQFMTKTAKRFGLKVDSWVDERRDPEKSTYAAAEYLKNLHEMFNCWYLATASYNAGEGKILEAMRRANSQDFWEISKHRYLRQETKEYVPMLMAAMIIAQDPQKYGFSQVNYQPPLSYEKVPVPPGTRLDRIARAAQIDIAEFRALNPSLRRDQTPPNGTPFEIKLPPEKKEVFEKNFFKINKANSGNAKKHRVRRGETLAQIAKKYRASLQELCEFNQISSKTPIRAGVTLLLPP